MDYCGEYLVHSLFGWKHLRDDSVLLAFRQGFVESVEFLEGDSRAPLKEEEKFSEELGTHPSPTL